MKTIESEEQAALFRWADMKVQIGEYRELALLNGSLNGVKLTIGQAVKAKKQGMKKGFPDIFLPVPRGNYHGLFIELKIKPYRNDKDRWVYPKVSEEQKWWLNELTEQGYLAMICKGFDMAQNAILGYLKLDDKKI